MNPKVSAPKETPSYTYKICGETKNTHTQRRSGIAIKMDEIRIDISIIVRLLAMLITLI